MAASAAATTAATQASQNHQGNVSNSPMKTRNHLLLNSAKLALIQNIKNKTKLSQQTSTNSLQKNANKIVISSQISTGFSNETKL